MSNRFFGPVLGLFAIIFVLIEMPAIGDSVTGFRATSREQEFNAVVTAAAVTNTSQILQYALLDNDVESITTLTSDLGTDSPVGSTYTAGTKTLLITGLTADASRNLTVEYYNGRLNSYNGSDTFAKIIPFIVLGFAFIIFIALVAHAVLGR
jgi:hypothetical protein